MEPIRPPIEPPQAVGGLRNRVRFFVAWMAFLAAAAVVAAALLPIVLAL